MEAYASEWVQLLIRWVHLITGIAWIGSSFYFVFLDNSLLPPAKKEDADAGIGGELWAVHGGGFYHVQKFRVAPATLPEPLHWFKWEAYWTWMSGFALFVVMYYAHAGIYMIDRSVADLDAVAGRRDFARAARRRLGVLRPDCASVWAWPAKRLLAVVDGRVHRASSRGGCRTVFSGRAMFLQVGAMLGTIMAWNVFFVIIPSQRKLVEAKEQGIAHRPGLRPARQAALGAQQLLHAAGAVHHDQQPLSDDVRPSRRRGWCWSPSCCWRRTCGTSSTCATGAGPSGRFP